MVGQLNPWGTSYFTVVSYSCCEKLIEVYVVCILASSIWSNVVPQLKTNELYVFLCLFGIMRVMIWTMQQKEFYGGGGA